ncbi:MAG: hypothetical protein DRP54_07140 [Spirochaetes bacterium]|nr:MAG: hypothetical protein DRP54_07140 [Spirochaetota bacterium]
MIWEEFFKIVRTTTWKATSITPVMATTGAYSVASVIMTGSTLPAGEKVYKIIRFFYNFNYFIILFFSFQSYSYLPEIKYFLNYYS